MVAVLVVLVKQVPIEMREIVWVQKSVLLAQLGILLHFEVEVGLQRRVAQHELEMLHE